MDWGVDLVNWPALNDRLCGVLIDFSLEEGLVLFLKEITGIMEIGNYLVIYLEEKSTDSKNAPALLLGRLKDLRWKSEEAIEEEYGFRCKDLRKGIKSESTFVIPGTGFGDTMPIKFSGNPHAIGKIDFLGMPKKIPYTWMKVFEASEEDIREVLKGTNESTGFKVKVGPETWVSVGFQEKHLTDNILIIGSYKDFLSLVMRQILKFSNLPKIVFAQKANAELSNFDVISVREFRKLTLNGFGFEYCSDEQILNAAASLTPHQVESLSNFLDQVGEEKKGESKFEMLKKIINKNMETHNSKNLEDLKKILNFLDARWDEVKNLNNLMGHNKTTIVDVSEESESKQIAFSRFLDAVMDEISNRKRNETSLLEFILFIEDIEDYIPSNSERELDDDKAESKEIFGKFISHPNTERIGLIMSTCFPSRIDPLVYYLCPNRLFGEVFEERELMILKEVFGIKEVEIRKLRDIPREEDEFGILLNFPSRFPVDVVDGILAERK